MDEPLMVLPVINPLDLMENYTPTIEDELMKTIGDPADADLLIFVSLSIPSDVTQMTANLKGPFIINTVDRKAMQVIVENSEYPVKFNAYEAIQAMKEKEGE
ncbi:MAG: flagellar assembly protein FliW [Lachnospiraceae bacterium]|nr:flagellar assembly protein FliW [Lachnospiraceae bacterium]